MINIHFIERQLLEIKKLGFVGYLRNRGGVRRVLYLPLYVIAIPFVVAIRLIRPWYLVRFGGLISLRIGHFAINTELYLCEKDALINTPKQAYIDLFHLAHKPICNHQLEIMWKRVLHIWPSWVLDPIILVNRLIAGGSVHEIGDNTQGDRDVHNLIDRFPSHLAFTSEEEALGKACIIKMGIPKDSRFVCLIVRDSAYLESIPFERKFNVSYHDYRDCDIQSYVMAAEELTKHGYWVIRMGVVVRKAMKTENTRIIDYAVNGMRSDFMDVYMGAKCEFCISVGTGFDAIPFVFRRPIVYTNFVPLGYLSSSSHQFLIIPKHYYSITHSRNLTMREIFAMGGGYWYSSNDYKSHNIRLVENTPEEICDVVIEMTERMNKSWLPNSIDDTLQNQFLDIFPLDAMNKDNGKPQHGEIRSRIGAQFLRDNRKWLQ
jgi:putative glycosyltransferase (TIGR04372 family)